MTWHRDKGRGPTLPADYETKPHPGSLPEPEPDDTDLDDTPVAPI
jgi:hypothetical protein